MVDKYNVKETASDEVDLKSDEQFVGPVVVLILEAQAAPSSLVIPSASRIIMTSAWVDDILGLSIEFSSTPSLPKAQH
jgi:hypothetical protein